MPDDSPIVFVVDDDMSVREATTGLLESHGYGTAAYGYGEECAPVRQSVFDGYGYRVVVHLPPWDDSTHVWPALVPRPRLCHLSGGSALATCCAKHLRRRTWRKPRRAKCLLRLQRRSTRESSAILHDMWLRLGYGQPTGIDVAGEVGGLVRDPGVTPWREIDLANGAFGQGVAVTPIQLARAYAALMNGGTMVEPHVVKSVGDHDLPAAPTIKVLETGLSGSLLKMMRHVITEVPFYRDRTLVPGYDVGGKTGTAQIWDPKANNGRGAWKDNLFNYSFVGYIGRHMGVPDLVVAIRIEEGTPTVARVGHLEMPVMSFELFRRIATDAITTPDLLADRPVTATTATDR
jgi:hypothetical protein